MSSTMSQSFERKLFDASLGDDLEPTGNVEELADAVDNMKLRRRRVAAPAAGPVDDLCHSLVDIDIRPPSEQLFPTLPALYAEFDALVADIAPLLEEPSKAVLPSVVATRGKSSTIHPAMTNAEPSRPSSLKRTYAQSDLSSDSDVEEISWREHAAIRARKARSFRRITKLHRYYNTSDSDTSSDRRVRPRTSCETEL